ncbi:neuronal acetylcholine receptor subunit alpha-7-like [Glandiceps talaboti]
MDERNQHLTVNVWLRQMWTDEFLIWNETQYDGLKEIRLPATSIWRPDIVLYNNVDEEFIHVKMDTLAIVGSTGSVFWMAPAVLKASCKVEVLYFPFDKQYCQLKFGSWAYQGLQLDLVRRGNLSKADMSPYMSNGEWDLVDVPVERYVEYYDCCTEPFPDLRFTVILRRRPLFYVFNLVLPNCLIAALTLVGFYLPPDSGEKVTMVITNLLTLIVFHQLLSESLPPTSDRVPLIALYFSFMIVLVSLSCFLTIWVLNLHFQDGYNHEVPDWTRKLVFGYLAKMLRIEKMDKGTRTVDISLDSLQEITQDINSAAASETETILTNSHRPRSISRYKRVENGRIHYQSVRCVSTPIESSRAYSRTEGSRQRQPTTENSSRVAVMSKKTEGDINEILGLVKQFSRRMARKDKRNHTLREWKELAHVVDRTLLVIFAILFFTLTMTLLFSAMRV